MSYTIRDANHSDILDITIAAKLFSKETNHPALNTINPNKVAATLQQLIDNEEYNKPKQSSCNFATTIRQ
jgi:hypothetical protein